MKLYGHGTDGKRLWFRTHDHRWIPVPYGAGQDETVRSINIWDGEKWMVPAWGWWISNRAQLDPTSNQFWLDIPSDGFYVHAPNVHWEGYSAPNNHVFTYNPNYGQVGFANFVWGRGQDPNSGTLQLFHTEPRNDPNWRIVPLGHPLPRYPVAQHYQNPYDPYGFSSDHGRCFWPGLSYATYHANTNQISSGQLPMSDAAWTTGGFLLTAGTSQGRFDLPDDSFNGSFVLDFAAIRKQLHDTFPEQGVYYQGQYTHIDQMSLKRVYIKGVISATVSIEGGHIEHGQWVNVDAALISGTTFTIAANTNTPVSAPNVITDPANLWPGEAHLRYPLNTDLSGPPIWQLTADGDDASLSQFGDFANWDHFVEQPFEFEGPGENNIKIACAIGQVPTVGMGDLRSVRTTMTFQIQRISLQYATVNHDVPNDLKRYDAIG
jgi:hypothetical protein